jgi:hypothetical protein
MGTTVLLLNCFLPGWGTFFSGFASKEARLNNIILGIIQIATSIILVGWVWSIYTGYLIWDVSK